MQRSDLKPGDVFKYIYGCHPEQVFYVGPMKDPPSGAELSLGGPRDMTYDVELISGPSMKPESYVVCTCMDTYATREEAEDDARWMAISGRYGAQVAVARVVSRVERKVTTTAEVVPA